MMLFTTYARVLVLLLALALPATAAKTRTQVIPLVPGWNAVFLEVTPERPDPADQFAGTPVDIVAGYFPSAAPTQFVNDPSADLLRETGWGVWYHPDRPDAFLSSLFSLTGQRPYLIHSKTFHLWQVNGEVIHQEIRWQPDAFNLVGFSVSPAIPPTFSQFFAGSPAHQSLRVYRLTDGAWRKVESPQSEALRTGEAFWIYCESGSEFQGPLSVSTPTRHGLILNEGPDDLVLRNQSAFPVQPRLVLNGTSGETLPLSILITLVGDPANPVRTVAARKPAGSWQQDLPPLEPGEAVRIPFEARTGEMTAGDQTCLLKIETDLGTEHWVPVTAVRSDLNEP